MAPFQLYLTNVENVFDFIIDDFLFQEVVTFNGCINGNG